MTVERHPWFQVLTPFFPRWARLGHPVFLRELNWLRGGQRRTWRRIGASGLSILMVAVTGTVVVAWHQGYSLLPHVYGDLYFPLWLIVLAPHLLLRIAATASTANAVNREVQGGNWAILRTTSMDLREIIGAKWAAGLWSVRFLLAWLLVLRVVLLVLLLGDMADFRGRSLSFMVESSQPTIPWVIGLITVAAGISCSLMQPAIVAGVDAATGIVLSVCVRGRGLAMISAVLIRMSAWAAAMVCSWQTVTSLGQVPVSDPGKWFLVLLFLMEGDWALGLLAMDWLIPLYGGVDWGFLVGPMALMWLLVSAWLVVGLIRLAAWRAARLGAT
jgi:hypothetical protein